MLGRWQGWENFCWNHFEEEFALSGKLLPLKGWLDFTFAECTRHQLEASRLKMGIMDVIVYLKYSKKWFSQVHFREFGQLQHLTAAIPFVLRSGELPFASSDLPFYVELLSNAVCHWKFWSCAPAPLLCGKVASWAVWERRDARWDAWQDRWAGLWGTGGFSRAKMGTEPCWGFAPPQLLSPSHGGLEYIINYHVSLFAACSSTTATLEGACATLPTLASAAGKPVGHTQLLQPLWSSFPQGICRIVPFTHMMCLQVPPEWVLNRFLWKSQRKVASAVS